MRAMIVFLILSSICPADESIDKKKAEAIPENVQAFKNRCEAERESLLKRLEKDYDSEKARLKKAKDGKDKQTVLADVKKSLEAIKAARSTPWHKYKPVVDPAAIGSIGEFSTPLPNHMRASVRFRADKVVGDTVTGKIIHDGAPPKVAVRSGGNIPRDIYKKGGDGSEQPAIIVGGKDFTAGKTSRLDGLFEVVETDPLKLKPFDIGPWEAVK